MGGICPGTLMNVYFEIQYAPLSANNRNCNFCVYYSEATV